MPALSTMPGPWVRLSPPLNVFLLFSLTYVVNSVNNQIDYYVELARERFDAGALELALSYYNEAVERSPNDYQVIWERIAVYLELNKSRSALQDLNRVLELQPKYSPALLQRGNILMEQGKLEKSLQDFQKARNLDPNNEEAWKKARVVKSLQKSVEKAKYSFNHRIYQNVINELDKPIELCPWAPDLREMRAESYMAQGEYYQALGDLAVLVHLTPDNPSTHLHLSLVYYQMGEEEKSRLQVRKCLELDSAHKLCVDHHRKVKLLVKQLQSTQEHRNHKQYKECISGAHEVLKTEPNVKEFALKANIFLCHCHSQLEEVNGALYSCQTVIYLDPDNVDAMLNKAKAHVVNEDYETAIAMIQTIQEKYGKSPKTKALLRKATQLQNQSKKLDYYDILNIRRDANAQEIIRAYRKQAGIWHPDKHTGFEKDRAHKRFIKVGEAKDVLTDPEKRKQFDARSQ